MCKIIFTILFSLFCCTMMHAQQNNEDIVFLENGSIIRGKIIMNTPDSFKIESCRNIFAFNPSEIEKIEFNQPIAGKEFKYYNKKGLFSYSTIGFITGNSEIVDGPKLCFSTIAGYEFENTAAFGIGVGVENFLTEIVPVFLSFKTDILKRQNAPFISFHVGYSFPLDDEKEENYNKYKYEGGVTAGFDIGICSYRNENRAFSLSAGYRYQHLVEKTSYNYWYVNSEEINTYDFNKLVIKIGFFFK